MIAYVILALTLLAGGWMLLRWFLASDPRAIVTALRWTLAGLGVALALVVVWGGARSLLFFALPMLLPIFLRSRWILDRMKAAQGPAPGGHSSVETRFLRMVLDHDSGAMQGTVTEGPFRGRHLDELSEEELLELWRDCRAEDEQSAAVLEAYLDRVKGAAWREAAGIGPESEEGGGGSGRQGRPPPRGEGMSRAEALEILGLQEGAAEPEIREAHRRLMQQLHPDHGGSNYLAAKINQAKQVLLGKR